MLMVTVKNWKILKRFLNNSTEKDKILSIHDKDSPTEIVTELNNYFAMIGPKLAANIRDSQLELNFEPKPNIPFFSLGHTNIEDVTKLSMSISDAKATGEDDIPIRFLKMTSNISAKILTHIIKLIIDKNQIHLEWKYAIETPLYKENDRDQACNYRPISILPAISKILEKTIHYQLYHHITANKLLSSAQFGFRKYHYTSTCVLSLIDVIFKNMDANKLTGVVFLDLKKAFDTIDHNILLKKLKSFNFNQNAIDWFQNYLSDRYQSVKYQGHKSYKLLVRTGVPQGSILGPL